MANGAKAVCKHHKNTLAADVIYKIHPAIGIARVGNASDFFIGPEIPGKGAKGADGGQSTAVPPYKSGGKIKRQAARFRIWKYQWNEKKCQYLPHSEVKLGDPGIKTIRWTVQLANRKASFFQFNGTNGEISDYSSNANFTDKLRNSDVGGGAAARLLKLDIDPDPVFIEGASAGPKDIKKSKPDIPIDYLGELRTDDKGRLLVLGGKGKSDHSTTLPKTPWTSTTKVWPALTTYANNITWFDDVSDGEVRVEIQFDSGKWVSFDDIFGAWVLVGPPDFAPPIGNIVTLYETMIDVALRFLTFDPEDGLFDEYAPGKGLKRLKEWKADFSPPGGFSTVKPSFPKDIYPILQRLLDYKWVHGNREPRKDSLGAVIPDKFDWSKPTPLRAHSTWNMNDLADPAAAKKPARELAFEFVKEPMGMTPGPMGGAYMPKLLGDEEIRDASRLPESDTGNPKEFLTLTGVQFALLRRWYEGQFDPDGWPAKPAPPADDRPEGLDQAALEACVGGAFFPGIEVGWLIRNKAVYLGPLRIDPYERDPANGKAKVKKDGGGKVEYEKDALGATRKDAAGNPIPVRIRRKIPYGKAGASVDFEMVAGYFSKQMAQPWQADFLSCNLEAHGPTGHKGLVGWWPGQRPDTVTLKVGGVNELKAWDRTIASREDLITHLDTRGFVEAVGAEYLEQEGPPP